MKFVRDTMTVFSREATPALRDPVGLVFAMGQPLLFLVLFGSLLGDSWQWFVPGILVMMCLFGPMGAGHSLLIELTGGSLERMLVTPLDRTAMLVGRTLKESITLLVQAVLIVALATTLGFEVHVAGVLVGLAVLIVFGIGLSSLSFVLAIKSQPSGSLFWIVTQTLMFPLILLSGVLLPMEHGPAWLRAAGSVNPISYIVDAQRVLFSGQIWNADVLYGTLTACAFAVVGLAVGTRVMRRGVA
ncbi:ABC transporter permease [Kibdelosporangium persicum]|uniref:Transport permease protein n=1 Tax=Kibdelosporangium persicum TaxID=2698649 RepID=A0ABX2F6T0_9PSEU|nr:ABC transporter permease [Kibdelosporangium persicum]NRN66665.1 Daunorubicin/doxorubicin resistance ABC transporter permease protein DrrB [Kibdelosporangium persicum]